MAAPYRRYSLTSLIDLKYARVYPRARPRRDSNGSNRRERALPRADARDAMPYGPVDAQTQDVRKRDAAEWR